MKDYGQKVAMPVCGALGSYFGLGLAVDEKDNSAVPQCHMEFFVFSHFQICYRISYRSSVGSVGGAGLLTADRLSLTPHLSTLGLAIENKDSMHNWRIRHLHRLLSDGCDLGWLQSCLAPSASTL